MESTNAHAEFTLIQPNIAPSRHSPASQIITLGRAADCTIPIKDRFLSRKHAEITFIDGSWLLRDCGSANGTFVNGVRVDQNQPIRPGDRITLGDSELLFELDTKKDELVAVEHSSQSTNLSMLFQKAVDESEVTHTNVDRLKILNALALELIEDRPMAELFDFILDRVMALLKPSRAALALLADDKKSFTSVTLRRVEEGESGDLRISRTLLDEVVVEKRVISFVDGLDNEKFGQAKSIISQSIRSALCAPLLVRESVVGVLYVDFQMSQRRIAEEDVRLVAQIARFAAVKFENTRLREESYLKQRMDEELRTAYAVQSRLLPSSPPLVPGYSFAGVNRPVRTVSGDYYDFIVQENGKIYFIIADVSGKGITAALIMAGLATAFNILSKTDPTPADLVREMNRTLAPKTAPTKFATVFVGILDPSSGVVEFANAGHVPPLFVRSAGAEELRSTDMVVGLFPLAVYRTQAITLEPGDALVLFTDGIIEAENEDGLELGYAPIQTLAAQLHGNDSRVIIERIEQTVREYVGRGTPGDDITIVTLSRES